VERRTRLLAYRPLGGRDEVKRKIKTGGGKSGKGAAREEKRPEAERSSCSR